jgi:transcriptional regulator with XRE-family HTH domain
MGKYPRQKQKRVGEKLRQIREVLGLSQSDIVREFDLPENYQRGMISNYENDHREPPLFILLSYAKLSGVCLDEIVDDEVDLPKVLPVKGRHHNLRKSTGSKSVKR